MFSYIFPLILLLFSIKPQGPTEKFPCPSFPGTEVSGLGVNMVVVLVGLDDPRSLF